MSEVAVKLDSISKAYKLYGSPGDRLKEALHPFGKSYHQNFHAINNVSLEIKKGEILGIVGRNGCGKSTLLKLISSVLTPNQGSITVNGKISALLELGSGFNPEFSGIQNIFFYGSILGFTRTEMEEKLEDIIAFADIGDFIYQPIKIYSSGMKTRIGFAVAINVNPEILILDEVLAVGDDSFRRKCYVKMKEFFDAGKTILFVSHQLQSINEFCTKCVLIESGEVLLQGAPDIVTKMYSKLLFSNNKNLESIKNEIRSIGNKNENDLTPTNIVEPDSGESINVEAHDKFDDGVKSKSAHSFGAYDIHFEDICIIDEKGNKVNNLLSGCEYVIFYTVLIKQDVIANSLNFGVGIGSEKNVFISGMHSNNVTSSDGLFTKGSKVKCSLKFKCLLLTGSYYLSFSTLAICGPEKELLRKLVDGYMFKVRHENRGKTGLVQLFLGHEALLT